MDDDPADAHVLDRANAIIKRVRRASSLAERNGCLTAAKSAELHNLIGEIQDASFTSLTIDHLVDGKEIFIMKDAGSLSSVWRRTAASPTTS